jgi:multidrug efflux pump subunit AcrB
MMVALGVSLVLIFLILLLQFRSVRVPLVVMVSIPLSVVGAVLGLLLTHNPFSFTAFIGLIGLMGLVVRNAIILVDYMNEQLAKGVELEQGGDRRRPPRLRPIFLTTMAAAAGVLPMILSGSSMWSPLASVLAMGLITSMVFTLLVVPVLYVVVERRRRGARSAPDSREGGERGRTRRRRSPARTWRWWRRSCWPPGSASPSRCGAPRPRT